MSEGRRVEEDGGGRRWREREAGWPLFGAALAPPGGSAVELQRLGHRNTFKTCLLSINYVFYLLKAPKPAGRVKTGVLKLNLLKTMGSKSTTLKTLKRLIFLFGLQITAWKTYKIYLRLFLFKEQEGLFWRCSSSSDR